MADLIHAVHHSNLPAHHKASLIDKWIGMARGTRSAILTRAGVHGMQAVHTVGEVGGGLLTGAAAGAWDAVFGLDHGASKIPIDAVVGGGLAALAIGGAHLPGARQAGVIGSQLGTVFSFRKVRDFVAAKRKAAGKPVGFTGEDNSSGDWGTPGFSGPGNANEQIAALAASLEPHR
jgi:hypothetical protein